MTGTHMKDVGSDYELMMFETKRKVLLPEYGGQMTWEVRSQAWQRGVEITSI